MDNDAFDPLKDIFNRFKSKYDPKDISARVTRSLAAGGKKAVEHARQEFPKTFISQFTQDFYDMVIGQETSDAISNFVRSVDEEKVKNTIDQLVSSLKDEQKALDLASKLKFISNKVPVDQIGPQLDLLVSMLNLPPIGQVIFSTFLDQFKPILQEIKDAPEEEIAQRIMQLADMIPGDMIAAQIANITDQFTPERVSKEINNLVGKLPAPQIVADTAHILGQTAEKHLDQMSKIADIADLKGIVADFRRESSEKMQQLFEDENKNNKKQPPKGGSFKL